mgnify:CR=1 FL=1
MTLRRQTRLLSLVLASLTTLAEASDDLTQRFKNIGFHLGSLTEFVGEIQVDDKGTTETFSVNPALGFSLDIELNEDWALIPELHWVLPREAGPGVSKNLFMLRTDFAWRGADLWRLRAGTSLMVNNMRGEGGTRTLNNGSSTSDFYVPAESRTSVNNTLDFGGELLLDSFALRTQLFIYSPLKSERRQYSYLLVATYYYDLGN